MDLLVLGEILASIWTVWAVLVFSGIVRVEPLSAALDALLADQAAYDSWKAHFGDPPNG